jgi:hypothetical protein
MSIVNRRLPLDSTNGRTPCKKNGALGSSLNSKHEQTSREINISATPPPIVSKINLVALRINKTTNSSPFQHFYGCSVDLDYSLLHSKKSSQKSLPRLLSQGHSMGIIHEQFSSTD